MKNKHSSRPRAAASYRDPSRDREGIALGDRERSTVGRSVPGAGICTISSGCSWLGRLPTADEQARGDHGED